MKKMMKRIKGKVLRGKQKILNAIAVRRMVTQQ
jgi:hypothetical protein